MIIRFLILIFFFATSPALANGPLINKPVTAKSTHQPIGLDKYKPSIDDDALSDIIIELNYAYHFYLERYKEPGQKKRYHKSLWGFALETPPHQTPTVRRHLIEAKLADEFIKAFDEAVAWAKPIFRNPIEAYRISKEFEKLALSDIKNQSFYASLSIKLAIIGIDAKVPQWFFDLAMSIMDSDPSSSVGILHRIAEKGYLPAIREIFDQYLNGKNIRKDPLRASDWLDYALFLNIDLSDLYAGEPETLLNSVSLNGPCCDHLRRERPRLTNPFLLMSPVARAK